MKNRLKRKISFLVVWLTMFSCFSGNGQKRLGKADLAPDFKHLSLPGANQESQAPPAQLYGLGLMHIDLSWIAVLERTGASKREYTIPPDIYYIQSGFFCKREWEVEKATHIPFRFRLGSLADLNAIEGKH